MAEEQSQPDDRLTEVHERAMRRFDATALPQLEMREHALLCRRFISVPGAMWEGPWGEQFENSIKVEIDKLSKGVEKIVSDYRENRIVPDFRPAGGDSDPETASTLDGIHRADSYHFKAQQARDNAFEEAAAGGFGAYRLKNELADEYDKDSDAQRINPGLTIVVADQRVFFDGNSKLYDKSDARFAFVLTAMTKDAFEEEHGDRCVDWPDANARPRYDWFRPDVVVICEYYEVEDKTEELLIFRHVLADEEQRWWSSEIEASDVQDLKDMGWKVQRTRRKRKRVHKYLMSGAEVLDDQGFIAGSAIPVVPVYGKRQFVDNMERFRGFVSKRMDAQRHYNAMASKMAELAAPSPREKPIFLAEQMPPHLADVWSRQEIDRHGYALVNPVIDQNGEYVAMGPIGTVKPPDVPPVQAAILQIANSDLMDETQDGADEVVANTSAEAMDIAATRIDAKSGIYLDNMRQSVQREGEIYLGMAAEVYFEPGRVVETMTEDGEDGEATLHDAYTDGTGTSRIKNNFATGKYKVMADVTEATATRRGKTVKSMLATAEVAVKANDPELAQVCIYTAILNDDGEGVENARRFARKKLVAMGVEEPNEEEKAAMEAAAQQQQPDPAQVLAEAQAKALKAGAVKDLKQAEVAESTVTLNEAKTVETLASAREKGAKAVQTMQPANDAVSERPRIRRGYEMAG